MTRPSRFAPRALVASLALLLAAMATTTSWLCDDAYITLRTIDNLAHGFGPRWNVAERVQAYTHPLWMYLLAAMTRLTGETYVTTMLLGLGISALAAWVLAARLGRGMAGAVIALALLIASRAYGDYATSGLENPLEHVLLGLFLVAFLGSSRRLAAHPGAAWMCAALAACTRPDAIVLCGPGLVWLARNQPRAAMRASALRAALVGSAPVAFSLFYYGALVPNSALAKLATDVPAVARWHAGMAYLWSALQHDPVTLVVAVAGALVAIVAGDRRGAAVGAGILLHLCYVVGVGGDFMRGRLLTPAFYVGVALLARQAWRPRVSMGVAAASVVAAALAVASPGWRSSRAVGPEAAIDAAGIADERGFYSHITGWRYARHDVPWPDPATVAMAAALRADWTGDAFVDMLRDTALLAPDDTLPAGIDAAVRSGAARAVVVRPAVGTLGYAIGPAVHVLDVYALCDPLLSRMPALRHDPLVGRFMPSLAGLALRPGHYVRRIPAGYVATLATGKSALVDADVASLWSDVELATRAPLWARGRFRAIARLAWPGVDARARRWAARCSESAEATGP